MRAYVIRRLLLMVPTLLILSVDAEVFDGRRRVEQPRGMLLQGRLVLVIRNVNERDDVDVGRRSPFDRLDVFNETAVDPLKALDKADSLQTSFSSLSWTTSSAGSIATPRKTWGPSKGCSRHSENHFLASNQSESGSQEKPRTLSKPSSPSHPKKRWNTDSISFRTVSRALIVLYSLSLLADERVSLFIDEPDNYLSLREIQPWLAHARAVSEAVA